MCKVTLPDGRTFTYEEIRKLMCDEPFILSVSTRNAQFIMGLVNQGIDSHLEACYVKERGDRYEPYNGMMRCVISPESFPVLLRRWCEELLKQEIDLDEDVSMLAIDMIDILIKIEQEENDGV